MAACVLLVHDDCGFLRDLTAALVETGHRVEACNEPLAALDALDGADSVDVLVTRVRFAEGRPNGVSLANMARRKRPHIKVIFTASAEVESHAVDLGLFLRTPVQPGALVDAVRDVMAS